MSIKDELTKTASYLRNARKAILGRGGEISLTAGLKDLPDAIYKIPPDASLAYHVDDNVAYQKIVPSSAEQFAQVAKIGGMSYRPNNLKIEEYNNTVPGTTSLGNGRTSINGTLDAEEWLELRVTLRSGTTYTASLKEALPEGITFSVALFQIWEGDADYALDYPTVSGTSCTFSTYDNTVEAYALLEFCFSPGTYNTTISPMVNEGNTALPYEPYFEGVRNTEVKELKSIGVNLFRYPYHNTSKTSGGIKYTDNGDGSVTIQGTSSANTSDFKLIYKKYKLPTGTYTVSGNFSSDAFLRMHFQNDLGSAVYYIELTASGSKTFTISKEYSYIDCYIRLKTNVTFFDTTIYPMLNYGTTALPFKPYRSEPVDTFQISEELRAFLEPRGYGLGIGKRSNYIDYERKKFIQRVRRIVLDGVTEGKKVDRVSTYNGLRYAHMVLSESSTYLGVEPSMLSSHFASSGGNVYAGKAYIAGATYNELFMYNTDQTITTVAAWNSWLEGQCESKNPVTFDYVLSKPIEIDISAYLTKEFIKVEGGGTIVAVNDYEYDVPSTINYIIKTVGE